MKTMMMVVVVLMLAACGGCDESGAAKVGSAPERLAVEWRSDGTYLLTIQFDNVPGYSGLVDEKTVDVTTTHGVVHHITECFIGTGLYDQHFFVASYVPGVIVEGRLYGADVSGANLTNRGFGVLPANADGSFVTDIDPEFPAVLWPTFFEHHPIAGQITRHDRPNAIHYRTESRVDGLLVTWNGVDQWFPRPTS